MNSETFPMSAQRHDDLEALVITVTPRRLMPWQFQSGGPESQDITSSSLIDRGDRGVFFFRIHVMLLATPDGLSRLFRFCTA
jgi:hypothetical protein